MSGEKKNYPKKSRKEKYEWRHFLLKQKKKNVPDQKIERKMNKKSKNDANEKEKERERKKTKKT